MDEIPTEPTETSHGYLDKSSGRHVSFTPKADEVVVRLRGPATTDTVARVVADDQLLSLSRGCNVHRGFAAAFVDPALTAAHSVAAELSERPDIDRVIPVMVDDNGESRYFLPDEFTAQFHEWVSSEQAMKIIESRGSRLVSRQRTPGYYTLSVPHGQDLFEAVRRFSARPEVQFAEPSEVGFDDALYVPDDPGFAQLWGLRNTGQTVNGAVGTPGADIRAVDAWDVTRGVPDVVIAIIDTGVDTGHEDLRDNILPRGSEDWDFADSGDSDPDDASGHGTHVAGTVGAVDSSLGSIGVAPGCRVMPLRINVAAGTYQNRADAINYVRSRAASEPGRRYVVNCSWRTSGDHAGIRTAIQNAVGANVLVVTSAGNRGLNTDITPQFPAVYPEVIAVAALDQRDHRAGLSNFGTNVDVAAPGVNIRSTLPGNNYGFMDGTSMAAPHVAGVAALVWSRNLALSGHDVRRIVENTCDDVDADNPGYAGMLGRGRVNAMKAVTSPDVFPT